MKRIKTLSLLLALCMIFSLAVPVSAFADETGEAPADEPAVVEPAKDPASVDDALTGNASSAEPASSPDEDSDAEEDDGEYSFSPLSDDADVTDTTSYTPRPLDTSVFYRIFHLDCGRKYFSADQIKAIIDLLAENDYTHMELAFGNGGMRFLLDDMSVTVGEKTYSSENVKSAITAGNAAFARDTESTSLTQAEMDGIITYASEKGIGIIPLLNTPGHMNALVSAMGTLGIANAGYPVSSSYFSASTINIEDETVKAFTQALIGKYISYFSGKTTMFNLGADEFANDPTDTSKIGFGSFGNYIGLKESFISYVNSIAAAISNGGMTPMMFNDGYYWTDAGFNSDIAVCYWTYGNVSSGTIAGEGHPIINTHQEWYYILGVDKDESTWGSYQKATNGIANHKVTSVIDGGAVPSGAMLCLWCDNPIADYSEAEVGKVSNLITSLAAANTDKFDLTKTITCPDCHLSVKALGLTSVICTPMDEEQIPEISGASQTVAYDITPYAGETAYTGEAQVSIVIPDGWDASRVAAYVVNADNTITRLFGSAADGIYTFTCPHFSTVILAEMEPVEVTAEKTIYVRVGETVTDTITGIDYTANVVKTELDEKISGVSATYQQAETKTAEKVTEITGGQYLIYNIRGSALLTSGTATTNQNTPGLALAGAVSADSTDLWTITNSGNGYTVMNADGQYLTIGANTASVSGTSATLNLSYSNSNKTWTISQNNYYLNDFGNKKGVAAGWKDNSASSDGGSQWDLYQIITELGEQSTVVSFTGASAGTTYVTVGNTRYTVIVSAEDLNTVSLTYHPWISTYSVHREGTGAGNCNTTEGVANPVQIEATANGVYSEAGAAISTLVWETGDWRWEEGAQTVFWKATVLGTGKHQEGNGTTDQSMSGTDFSYIRYWGGNWSVSTDQVNWININTATDEVCAYYLQQTAVTAEVDTYVKDWAYTPSTTGSGSGRYQKALSFAVVYPSGQMSPSSEAAIYSNSTLIYWDNLKDLGFIRVGTNEIYEVEKITYTFGERASGKDVNTFWNTNDSIKWEKATQADGSTWYNETTCWDESYGTEPVVNGVNLEAQISSGEPLTNIGGNNTKYDGTWGYNDAVLILIYLKPIITEDSLKVVYWDDKGNNLIYNYPINISNNSTAAAGTFLNRLMQTSPVNVGTFELDDDAYVVNAKNQNETFEKVLTKIPNLQGKYASGLYAYSYAELSEDGKTLTLHYTMDDTKLTPSYVVDFGLPVVIPFSDLGNVESIQSIQATAPTGTVTVDSDNKQITYAPSTVYSGIVVLSVTVTYNNGTTQLFNVGITPATTVYYEEGFATGGEKGTVAQQKAKIVYDANNKTYSSDPYVNNYGFDSVYAGYVGASNNTDAVLSENVRFSFTGTGVDIYTNNTTISGTMAVLITTEDGSLVKLARIVTAMVNGGSDATTGQAVTAYNVPVYSVDNLAHGNYNVEIALIEGEVKLDGFRVYNTLEVEPEFFKTDLEDFPAFIELRDLALTALRVDSTTGQVHTNESDDITAAQATLTYDNSVYTADNVNDVLNNGPKNEIYLMKGMSLTFKVSTSRVVQIGLKALDASTSYTINNGDPVTLNASTDMFYKVPNKGTTSEQTITIKNTGDGILSITKLKICDDPGAAIVPMTVDEINVALAGVVEPEEPVVEYADATLTVVVNDATTTLTQNGVKGETATFTAEDIEAAAQGLVPEGYELKGQAEAVTVVYGESDTVTFSAEEIPTEPEEPEEPEQPSKPANIISAVIRLFDKIFGSLKGLFR